MSAEAEASAPVTTGMDRDLQDILDDIRGVRSSISIAREELIRKIEEGRVRDAENERVRAMWNRDLGNVGRAEIDALRLELKVVESAHLEELQADVEALKEAREVGL